MQSSNNYIPKSNSVSRSVLWLQFTVHVMQFPRINILYFSITIIDRLCGLVVRVYGYRYRGPGFDPRRYQIF